MKKYSILPVFILLFTGSLFSQEIVGPGMGLEGIYTDFPIDSIFGKMETDSEYYYTFSLGYYEKTFSVCPNKGMWIYGIAAPFVTIKELYTKERLQIIRQHYLDNRANGRTIHSTIYDDILDTTYDQCFEYFRFYKKTASNGLYAEFEMMKEGMVHVLDSNVIGYFDCGNSTYEYNGAPITPYKRYIPIRAIYFDEPIFVSDTFYIGMTNYNWSYPPKKCRTWYFHHMSLSYESTSMLQRSFYRQSMTGNTWKEDNPYYDIDDSTILLNFAYTYIFPLLDSVPMYPSPLVTGGEMAGAPVLTVENFVSVAPNPATESATIASSFPLEAVELYDLGGSLLLRQPCSGLSLSLDLRPFPSGTYILKAETRNGTATKKLIKQ